MNVFILPQMNILGTRINTDRHGFCHAEKIVQRTRKKICEIRVGIKSILGREIIICGNHGSPR